MRGMSCVRVRVSNVCVARNGGSGQRQRNTAERPASGQRAGLDPAPSLLATPPPPPPPPPTRGVRLGGQLARHLLLQAAQHKGPQQALHALSQLGNLLLVALQSE